VTGVLWTVALTLVLCSVVAVPIVRAARRAGATLVTRGEVAEAPQFTPGRAPVPHTSAWLPLGARVVCRSTGRHGEVIAIRLDCCEYIVLGDYDGMPFRARPDELMRESIVAGDDLLAAINIGSLHDDLDEYERTGRLPW
jgi:hypothetical protein